MASGIVALRALLSNKVISGGRNTTASNVRDFEGEFIASSLNIVDGGRVVQSLAGYSSILTPTDDRDWTPKKWVLDQISSSVPSGVLFAANNLSDVSNASTARTNLGLAIGTNVQAWSANLNAWSAIGTASKLNVDGTIAMTGNLDLGGNNAINVNIVKVNNGGGLYNLANNAHINLEADGHIDFTGTGIIATTVPYLDASKNLVSSSVTPAELGYLSGVTSAIQTQLNTKGSGSVTTASVVTANGISGTVANPTTTPAITLTLGAITPSSVNGVTLSGSATPTLAVTGTTTVSGTNTGDQTITLTGDITGSGTGSFATTIGANKVTYTKSYNGNQLSIVATMKLLTGN